ncbi:MAG: TIGR03905 family TSCPD domain-containing protein [Clostridia bacterium]|nr:TIGR03905 family TSCPD domain-containing protein [Clostridia bacterium]
MQYTYYPQDVCSRQIDFDIEGNVIKNVRFTGGCNGNLKAISKLVDGMTVEEIERILGGNTCGANYTSCADQFARAVRAAYNAAKEEQ